MRPVQNIIKLRRKCLTNKLFHQNHTYENSNFIFSQGLEKPMQKVLVKCTNLQIWMKKSTKKAKRYYETHKLEEKRKKSQFQTQNPSVMIE